MAFKFPFTNYHELNLTWVLDQLKKLFEESAENVTVIENYNGRLTAVETELPLVSETAQGAAQTAANAASLAQTAKSTADTAQENAIQAQGLAGQARQEAQAAQRVADAATQAAQQAQSVAQNFDGRITEAQNNASEALEASRSFENRVQSAITTANNAARTATDAQGVAQNANQNAAAALDKIGNLSTLTTEAKQNLVAAINEVNQTATEADRSAKDALDKIGDLSNLTTTAKQNLVAAINEAAQSGGDSSMCAPIIINTASGSVASFTDGANNRPVEKLTVNIEPVQSGTGDPSPDNVRTISGWTGANIVRTGINLFDMHIAAGDSEKNIILDKPLYGNISFSAKNNNVVLTEPVWRIGLTLKSGEVVYIGDAGAQIRPMPVTVQIPEDNPIVKITCRSRTMTSGSYDFCIKYGTDTEYIPYIGTNNHITFPVTIYGGSVEVIGGDLKSNMSIVNMGDLNWAMDVVGSNFAFFIRSLPGAKIPVSINDKINAISEMYKTVPASGNIDYLTDNVLYMKPNGQLFVVNKSYTDAASFKAAMSGVMLCYELETPIDYTIEAQTLDTLYGINYIWSNVGPIGEVQYPADTKLYIDNKFAELQALILEH